MHAQSLIFRLTAGFGTLRQAQGAGLHRAVPSTTLDKVFNCRGFTGKALYRRHPVPVKEKRSAAQKKKKGLDKREYTVYIEHTQYIRGVQMTIFINNQSGQPIYEQIFAQIRGQILSGALAEDEALPSIRNLAKDLRISVITTKRAYEELEAAGFIYTLAGKGSFVAPRNAELMREEHLRQIEEHLSAVRQLAAACGLSRQELHEMLDLLEEDET